VAGVTSKMNMTTKELILILEEKYFDINKEIIKLENM
jgi:hypothetical protein